MGNVVNFPQSAKQLRELGLQAFNDGDFHRAVSQLEQLEQSYPDDVTPNDDQALATAYMELGEADEANAVIQDVVDDIASSADGRQLLIKIAAGVPDFPLGSYVINMTEDDTETTASINVMAEVMERYVNEHGSAIKASKRHLRNLGGMNLVEQEQFVTTELSKLPYVDVDDSLAVALVDPDVHPAVRSSLVTWSLMATPATVIKVLVYDRVITVDTTSLVMPGDDDTSQAVLGAIVDKLPEQEELVQMLVPTFFVLLGFLYPAVDEFIQDVDEFAATAVDPQRESPYRELIDWLTAKAQELSDVGTNLDN